VVAIGLLGFLMSTAFDLALGREAGFSDDTPMDWWIFGARSLVAPAVYVGLAVIAIRAAAAAWDLAVSMIPVLRRWHDRGRTTLTRTLERTGAGAAAAPRLLLAHIAALAFVLTFFSDIVSAVPIWVDSAPAEALAVLHPDNGKLVLYRAALTLLVLTMLLSWRALRRAGRPVDRGTTIGAAALLAITILLLEVPWRLIYKSDFERVEYAGARCYETGRRGREMLLFCPDAAPPRNLVRAIDDPLAKRTGDWDNIFGPAR
jgi:hypothetical protein